MKSLIFAAALGISSVALAQTTGTTGTTDTGTEETTEGQTTGTEGTTQTTGTGTMSTDTSAAGTGATGTMGTDTSAAGTMTTTTDATASGSMSAGGGMSGGGGTVAPGNTNPERDARGIAVVSDAATAPAGANASVQVQPGARVVASPNQAAAFQTQPSSENYQACTRTITDNCVQTYERGSRRR